MSNPYSTLLHNFKTHGQPRWSAASEEAVLEPYTYLLSNPGKDIRSTLIHAFNHWLQVPAEGIAVIQNAVEMLHTASLLIDDVEDSSDLRRGRQAAHLKYGPASTINAANYVYFSAMALIRSTGNAGVIAIYEEEILNLHRGQGLELFWRDGCCGRASGFVSPSEGEYLDMVNNKTGGLLRMAVRLMQALSPGDGPRHGHGYVPLANLVGILFQVRDDYMNLASPQYCREKGFCEDLTEGKFSFPIIHAIRESHPLSLRLREILISKTSDVAVKVEACEILRQVGSLEYTIRAVHQMDALCREEVATLGGNEELTAILNLLRIQGDGCEIKDTIAFAKKTLDKSKHGKVKH
ncbi:Geranylgeranyl pyrophosphate synthase [Taphrina deformans PYCC 5710]|uniref:Geranylgeranyl pyrophosphate synthase n=1 Tax=Taphrina deformans (strain PYCC 5710 / ATCC 11124 / CBS 356.35 / IMI 108563 / JCM 9778 / NBRC 8474) TaxID=1097556 RepID=R4XCS8_TAPDE|nr:Geranylgeranyl pyrophosphate synthase [Taphrina deformans PYCC 5710]|eukprot:CCG82208.1 Geranylgeranyl pyrophosphate synthase [Taphrina deformans PYCC 5710]